MSCRLEINFTLNGRPVSAEVAVETNALAMLRDEFDLTGTKLGCGEGECGACTILIDGESVNSCLMFAVDCDGRDVTTIEGLMTEEGLSLLQKQFVEHGAAQCGFCTPGMLLQGAHLLHRDPDLSEEDIKRGLEGNLCRCSGYMKIVEAIADTAHKLKDGDTTDGQETTSKHDADDIKDPTGSADRS